MSEKLFTKSAFKIATHCRTQAYYYRNPDIYENQSASDEFLKSLAEGGFQVGELAKIYGEVPPENDLEGCVGYDEPLKRTRELFEQENVNIAEAAFRYKNCFVRADIIQKDRNEISLIEVKAKSWNSNTDKFTTIPTKGENKGKETVNSKIRDYLYDVAFQKWVIENALKIDYPDKSFKVTAFLMMPDKSKVNTIQSLNSLFRIKNRIGKNGEKRAYAEIVPGAIEIIKGAREQILYPFPVDNECQKIIEGKTAEQEAVFGSGIKFVPFIEAESKRYVNNERVFCNLGSKCFKCPFILSDEGKAKSLKSGFKECWEEVGKLGEGYFDELGNIAEEKHFIKDLNGTGLTLPPKTKNDWIQQHIYFIDNITESIYPPDDDKTIDWNTNKRKWIQINGVKNRQTDASILKDELKAEMDNNWHYPYHMIDFETTASALPFFENMRPYEQVAFQFSHHIIYEDGRIEHAGQFLETQPGKFPNFDFVRKLKEQLEKDNGSVFRYATHENSILRAIRKQLVECKEHLDDKKDLIDFIDSITHVTKEEKENGVKYPREGVGRNMIDLCDIVKRFYWHPRMKGSNSIKAVLPAVLNDSKYLQEKYGKPIYGSEIESQNYSLQKPITLVVKDANGEVINPYKALPQLDEIRNNLIQQIAIDDPDAAEALRKAVNSTDDNDEDEGDTRINNGGIPLVLFRKFQTLDKTVDWEKGPIPASLSKAKLQYDTLRDGLLRYCELDTMAMVLVWEYFNHEVNGSFGRAASG